LLLGLSAAPGTVGERAPVVAHRYVVTAGSGAAGAGQAAGSLLAPCKDTAYKLNGSRWTGTLRWSFRATSTPKGIGRSAATAALKRAASNVVNGRSSCGLIDRISATEHYLGRTTTSTNIDDSSRCGRPDGKNVVGFGKLRPLDMAITCWWTRGGETVEADIKLNKAAYRWVTRPGPTCGGAWSIEDVATHELGHAFGLDHVGEGVHGNLTMSPLILPCQNGETTLGLGDVRGLRALY